MVTREMLEASDQKSLSDGTWGKCPHSRVGTCITQDELDRGTVWARPVQEEPDTLLGARLASMQAGIGILHRLW